MLHSQLADGSKPAELLVASEHSLSAPGLDRSGRYLVFEEARGGGQQ